MPRKTKRAIQKFLFWLLLAAISFYALFPFYYSFVTSFKTGTSIFQVDYWPSSFSLQNYLIVFQSGEFGRNIINSVLVAVLVVLISLLLGVFASYSLARIEYRGRKAVLLLILASSMFPQVSVLAGLFEVISYFKLFDSLWSLVFSYMIFTIPFTVWVLTTFMRVFPKDLEHAAWIDGTSTIKIIFRIVLPVMWPALVSVSLLSFIASWNELLFALTFISSLSQRTVPVAIATLTGATEYEVPWGPIMAASMLVTVPLIVLVLIFQNKITSGLTAGAVKG